MENNKFFKMVIQKMKTKIIEIISFFYISIVALVTFAIFAVSTDAELAIKFLMGSSAILIILLIVLEADKD